MKTLVSSVKGETSSLHVHLIISKNHDQLISTEINTMGCRKPDGRTRLQYNKLSDQEHQTHPVQKRIIASRELHSYTYKELSSTIFQSLSVSELGIVNNCPVINSVQYIKA